MAVRQDLAEAAIARLADRLGLGVMETAQGILSVVTANMARAIRVISVQRGHDPRDYTLVAFGGAGPLHAARLARELDIGRVLVPRNPGILCAMGLLLTDLRADFAATRLMPLRPRPRRRRRRAPSQLCSERAERLVRAGGHRRRRAGGSPAPWTCATPGRTTSWQSRCPTARSRRATLDGAGARASPTRISACTASSPRSEPVQLVTFRVEATGLVRKAELPAHPDAGPDASARIVGQRDGVAAGGRRLRDLPDLRPRPAAAGQPLRRPAIVEQMDTTTLVLPGMTARVDAYLNLILEFA